MPDYPLMVWEMYATSPEGERVYCGDCDYERGADALCGLLEAVGYTDFEKRQVSRGNHGQSWLPRARLQ